MNRPAFIIDPDVHTEPVAGSGLFSYLSVPRFRSRAGRPRP